MDIINELRTVTKKQVFETVFCSTVLGSIILWLIGLFYMGQASVQYDFFFLRNQDLFADFINLCGYSSERDVYNNLVNGTLEKIYPPLSYVITYIFSRIDVLTPNVPYRDSYTQQQFLIMIILAIVGSMILMHSVVIYELKEKTALRFLVSIAVTFSGIMVYTIERGNFLFLTVLCCMIFAFWYDSDSKVKREISLFALALAAAFKLSPAILGILLIYDKKYKEAVRAAIYGGLLIFLPFLFFKGGFANIRQMFINQHDFFKEYAHVDGYSFSALIRYLLGFVDQKVAQSAMLHDITKIIMYLIVVLLLASSWKFTRKWEKVLSVSTILVIYPQVSQKYSLLYFMPALVMFLNDDNKRKEDWFCLIAFVLICLYTWEEHGFDNYKTGAVILLMYILVKMVVNIFGISKMIINKILISRNK